MITSLSRLAACAALALLVLSGCSGAQTVESKPLPPGVNLSGNWWSTQYENMVLSHKGDTVTGTFTYRTGGTIEGKLDGDVLYFEWVQPGDFEKARREVRGSGYLRVSPDGRTMEGRWGYDDDRMDGGEWSAEKQVESDPDYDVNEPLFKK